MDTFKESFVTLPADVVKSACFKYLDERQEQMRSYQEANIQKKMKGGLFKSSMTREQAIESMYGVTWSDYSLVRLCNEHNANRVFALKNLADVASIAHGKMHVSCSDANILHAYLQAPDVSSDSELAMSM